MIRLDSLTKRYGSFPAVKNLSLDVPAGELFGFLGPNGAGKTTTIKMIAGLLKPTSGQVFLDGHDLEREPVAAKAALGFIPDRPFLYEKLSASEFLRFVAGIYGINGTGVETRSGELLELVELSHVHSELIESFSHGMKQRLVMAASFIHDPKVLVVDEPMVGLDPKGARLIKRVFREYCDCGMTVFVSTHTLEVTQELCDRIGIILKGELVALGSLEELRHQGRGREFRPRVDLPEAHGRRGLQGERGPVRRASIPRLEFTPRDVTALLTPSFRAVRNRRLRSHKSDWLRFGLFAGVTLFFALFVFGGSYRMLLYIGQFAEFTAPLTNQILGTVCTFILTVLFASMVVSALSTQYLSDDLSLLVASPVPLPALYGSRLVLTTFQSSWMVLLFSIPIFAAFALTAPAPYHFMGAAGAVLPPLVIIATAGGSMLTSLLMASLPARRVREMLVLLGALFIVLLVFLIRMQQPEKLLNPRSIYDVTEFFSAFRTPSSPLLPSSWAATVLIAGRRAEPMPWLSLGLLLSSAGASVVFGCWLFRALYLTGYSRAQESRPARFSSMPVVDRILKALTQPFELRFRSLLLKDLRTFVRDTTQWSQLLLLLALIVVYLYNFSVLPENFAFATFYLQNVFSFLNLGLAGFVLSAVAVRFVFTSVSAEGRAFWIIRTSPLTTGDFL